MKKGFAETSSSNQAESIIKYLQGSGHEQHLDGGDNKRKEIAEFFQHWKMLHFSTGEDVLLRYLSRKPAQIFEDLQQSNPSLFDQFQRLIEIKKEIGQARTAIDENDRYDIYAKYTAHKALNEKYADDIALIEEMDTYMREHIYDFRPPDYPISFPITENAYAEHLTYAVFQNHETGEYLLTMRDARKETVEDTEANKNDVQFETFVAPDVSPEDVLQEAHDIWEPHFLHLMRYTPVVKPILIDIMQEADALRSEFGVSSRGNDVSAYPSSSIFYFYPAFRRAYDGDGGFYRALVDVLNNDGPMKEFAEEREPNHSFANVSSMFVEIYALMGEEDKSKFRTAFEAFKQHRLPVIKSEDLSHYNDLIPNLMLIEDSIRHGRDHHIDLTNIDFPAKEIERLSKQFKRTAPNIDTSSLPQRIVFEIPNAFHQVYNSQSGFFRALCDVFGANGNVKQVMDHPDTPFTPNGHDLHVGFGHICNLYRGMGPEDRTEFRAAFDRFVPQLPTLYEQSSDHATRVGKHLSVVDIALRYGAGALQSPLANTMVDMAQQRLETIMQERPITNWAIPEPKW